MVALAKSILLATWD